MNNMGLGIALNVKGNFKAALQGVHGRWSKFRTGIKTGVAGIGARIKGLGSKFKTFKGNMLGVFASVLVGVVAFKKIIGVSVKFQQSIANVAAISGEAQKELSKLARVAGMNTVFSASQAADAMYFLASAGLKLKDMSQVLTPTLNLAAAAQMGIAEATDMVVNNLKVFGGDMTKATEYVDVMAKTVTASNTDLAQLGQALSYSGATASVAGIKFDELNAILATMADQGVKGTRAGTQLRMAFTRLMKPTSGAVTVLEKYGITTAQITKLLPTPIKLFEMLNKANLSQADALTLLGTRQANVFSIIKTGIPRMKELQKTLKDAGGSAERMALIQVDTLSGAMKLLKSAWEEIIISGSTGLLPVFKEIIWILIKTMRAFIKLPGPIKAVIGVISFLIPLILILTKVVMAFGVAFSAAIWPVTLIVLAIAAVIAVIIILKKYWKQIWGFIVDTSKKVWEFLKRYSNIITIFAPWLGIPILIAKHWGKIKTFFVKLWNDIKTIANKVWSWASTFFPKLWKSILSKAEIIAIFMPLIGLPLLIIKHWGKVKDFFKMLWSYIAKLWKGVVTFLRWIKILPPAKVTLVTEKEKVGIETAEKEVSKMIKVSAEKEKQLAPEVTVNNQINIGNEKVHESQKDYIKEFNLRNFVFVR